MMLIRIFQIESKANDFAKIHNGKIEIRYNWDSIKNKMIKEYVVKFTC